MTTTKKSARVFGWIGGVALVLLVILTAVGLSVTGVLALPAQTPPPTASAPPTPILTAQPEEDEWEATPTTCVTLSEERAGLDVPQAFAAFSERHADKFEACRQLRLAECRPIAAMAYMEYQLFDFSRGEYTVGEANVDHQLARSIPVGPNAFRDRNGEIPTTRAQLQEAFESEYEGNVAMMDRLRGAYPSLSDRELFDPSLWEIAQVSVVTEMSGNTGYSFFTGRVLEYGSAFQAQAGETFWLFIDPVTCVVRPMEVQPANANPDEPAVGVIRAACLNGGTGLNPKDPSKDPWQRGNAPIYGGPNLNPGVDEYIAPGDMDQPGSNPRVDPTPTPSPTIPVGSTPDPAPAPTPQPSAPPPTDPVRPDEGSGCAPGLVC